MLGVVFGFPPHTSTKMYDATDVQEATSQFRKEFGYRSIPIQALINPEEGTIYIPAYKTWDKADETQIRRFFPR